MSGGKGYTKERLAAPASGTIVAATMLLALAGGGCSPSAPPATGPIRMHDMTDASQIAFRHTHGGSGERYIVESVSAGLATFDYNGDGRIDIYFLNGAPLRGTSAPATPPRNALYRNDGNWHFTDVTAQAGVGDTGYGLGVTVGDYDNDGDEDIYLNNYGPNVLYRNNGDGTFTDVTAAAGVANGNKVGAGTVFLDIDNDGDLDLYAANYIDFTYENHVPTTISGVPSYAGPLFYHPVPDTLYRNNGDGTFTDVSEESGIGRVAGSGMGMVAADYDDDGDVDVFVCNDSGGNFFFRNDGRGHFEEVGLEVGASYNYFGDAAANMGADCGDYNNDGRLDFFVTNYAGELPVLLENVGGGLLDDVTRRAGSSGPALAYVTWGAGFADFDNDGWRDLYIACGHIDDNVELRDDSTAYRARNVLMRGMGGGKFTDVSATAGDGLLPCKSSRGIGLDDLDNDGDIDVVVLNTCERPTLLRNDSPPGNHWLALELCGTASNRDAAGARVRIIAGKLAWVDEVHRGRGYQSHWGSRLHFGLGRQTTIDRLEVRWPSGSVETFTGAETDRRWRIVEGTGRAAAL